MTGQPGFFCNEQLKELSAAGGSEGREAIGVQASLRTTDFAPFAVRRRISTGQKLTLGLVFGAGLLWLSMRYVASIKDKRDC